MTRSQFSKLLKALPGRLSRHFPWSCIFGLLATGTAAIAVRIWTGREQTVLTGLIGLTDHQAGTLRDASIAAVLRGSLALAGLLTGLASLAALLAFVRSRVSLWLLKAAATVYTVLLVFLLGMAWRVPAVLHAADSEIFPGNVRNELWVRGTVLLLPSFLLAAIFLLLLVLRSSMNLYRHQQRTEPLLGDRIWRNLRTHGRDPHFRKSSYAAALIHIFAIFVLPFILFRWGCQAPYGVPKGSGSPVLEMIKIKKIKKKKEKKFILNMNTAISFYVPRIDESEVFEEVEKLTEHIYEVQHRGALGAGGGKKGGWPDGMEKAKVRFIRLQYDGGDWDQDMGVDADYNMLLRFRKLTGFNIWPRTESVRIRRLERFPRKRAPPFVYITGGLKGRINISQAEVRTLRKYCLKMGGMIFADNGGGNFDRCFRTLLRRTFPELPVVEIAYDDVIFRQPFVFPYGAPPLWHHSGNRALGVKYRGRWIVFYHQGDINDAWKKGHSGVSEGLAMQAYKLGVNVINYAFNQYMQINYAKAGR